MLGKEELLNKLIKIPFKEKHTATTGLTQQEKQYLNFTKKVWNYIEKTIQKFPHYEKVKDLFYYDTSQFLNTAYYAYLIYKNPYYLNSHEFWLYILHSMQILINLDLDLMCASKFEIEDIGRARRVILCLQEMGRIGNWLVTWEKEIKSNDFTSIVIAYALEQSIITFEDLQSENKNEIIEKIKNSSIEKLLLKKEWETHYEMLRERAMKSRLIDTEQILKRARYLIFMHSMSRGLR